MCTALSFFGENHLFGRTLDLENHYSESVIITPKNYPLKFKFCGELKDHYAIIGIGIECDGYPLYFDASNEKGLSMAGLRFKGNAVYFPRAEGADNIAPFEFIPWILSSCKNVAEAVKLLRNISIVDIPFSPKIPNSPLHWIISDSARSVTVESEKEGFKMYENPLGVLTNNPSFDILSFSLNNYRSLSSVSCPNTFSKNINLDEYSLGLSALGLPGDYSSMSRFVRTSFLKENSNKGKTIKDEIVRFFHLLSSVEIPLGAAKTAEGRPHYTVYTSCCDAKNGIYYYKTYENSRIIGVDIHTTDLSGCELLKFELRRDVDIFMENKKG